MSSSAEDVNTSGSEELKGASSGSVKSGGKKKDQAAPDTETVAKTRWGKTLTIRKVPRSNGMVEIFIEEGGELPKELRGLFTSNAVAKEAVKVYKARKNLE